MALVLPCCAAYCAATNVLHHNQGMLMRYSQTSAYMVPDCLTGRVQHESVWAVYLFQCRPLLVCRLGLILCFSVGRRQEKGSVSFCCCPLCLESCAGLIPVVWYRGTAAVCHRMGLVLLAMGLHEGRGDKVAAMDCLLLLGPN